MYYVAIINTPGYLPDAEPALFDSAAEAWEYLSGERNQHWLEADDDGGPDYDPVMAAMYDQKLAGTPATITGPTPGYTGDHDLGVVYTVEAKQGEVCSRCDHTATTSEALHQHMLDSHLEEDHR